MIRKDVLRLLTDPEIEKSICGLLVSRGLVRCIDLKYNELILTPAGLKASNTILPDVEFVSRFRMLFPAQKRSTKDEVSEKLAPILLKYSEEDVIQATVKYLASLNNLMYCEKAGNFVSKKEGSVTRSTLSEYLELVQEEKEIKEKRESKGESLYGNTLI